MKAVDPAQLVLFDPPPGVPVVWKKPRPPAGTRYAKFRPARRVLCGDCILDIHERTAAVAPVPRGSTWRCTTPDGAVTTVCDAHYRARRGEPA